LRRRDRTRGMHVAGENRHPRAVKWRFDAVDEN